MWRIDEEYVGPLDQLLEDLRGAGRLQVERDAALVAVGEMPLIGFICVRLRRDLVRMSPRVAARRFDFDDVGAEIRQDDGGAGRRDEACEVNHLESRKNVVAWHWVSPKSSCLLQRPRNCGARFSRKADVPSFLSSVPAHRPK